jgi:hypothetical protein
MMLAMLLFSLLSLAAVLATSSMFDTWRQYAAAWDAVDAEMRGRNPAPVRHVTVRVVSAQRSAALAPMHDFRAKPPAFRSPHGLRAVA